jgi:peptide/nickel transport system substrate-binding protein
VRARAERFAVTAIAALLCASIAACSRVSQSGVPSSGEPWMIPGVVRISVNTDVNSFDPVISKLYTENYVEEAIFSGLVEYDSSGRLIPDLATEVPSLANGGISRDGRTITYRLRRGALWQDGVPVTSADVAFTYHLIMDPHVDSPVQSTYARIARLDTPDPYTVVLHLARPFAPVLSQVFCNGGFGEIVPEHVLRGSRDVDRDPFNQHPIGSGPFALERWVRGSVIVLRANPRYFGGAPRLREIDVLVVPDESTQLVEMESHQLDIVPAARPSQLSAYRAIPGTRIILAPSYDLSSIDFNTTRAPFDDPVVRRALAMALDRPRIVRTAYAGTATPAQTFIPPYNWAFDPDNGAPPYDPGAAARMLDDDGWHVGADGIRVKDGKRLSFGLIHYEGTTPATLGVEVQAAWRAIGAEALLRAAPRNVVVGQIMTSGDFNALVAGAGYDVDPDRSQYQETRFEDPHGFNDARYSDADVDRWTEAALQTYDRARRKRYYALIQRRLNRDVPYIPIAWERFVDVESAGVRGYEPETVNSDFWNVQDWSD